MIITHFIIENNFCDNNGPLSIQFLIHSKTPDHWYMRYNIIIYKLQWFTGEGHKKGEAKYNKCKKRKNKYKIHANVVKKSQEEQTLFRIFLISLESDFRVSI